MIASPRPSAVRVLGKSMHALSAGWMVAVGWLWLTELQQDNLGGGAGVQYDTMATVATLVAGLIPAALLVLAGVAITGWTGPSGDRVLQRQEWWHAFWWSAVPNVLLLIAAWVMIQEGK